MNENNIKLWDKNVNDLTVGDTLKISAASMAISAALIVGIVGVSTGAEKLVSWNQARKIRRLNKRNEEV